MMFVFYAGTLKGFKAAYLLFNLLLKMSFFSFMDHQGEELLCGMSSMSHHNIMSNNNISLTG